MSLSHHRLSIRQVEHALEKIDPIFLNTPQYNCESLSELLQLTLINKIETLNPIRSFKGRGAEVLVSNAKDGEHLICASAGNFGQAVAYSCRKRKIKLTVYASVNANPYKLERIRSFGAKVIQAGEDFDAAKLEAKKAATKLNARFVEDSQEIETLEGAATIGLELLKLPQKSDALLIAIGNGSLFNGIARVFKELNPTTKMIAVQAKGAPAMIESWKAQKLIAHNSVQTIADGIAVRIPVPQALEDMRDLVDDTILVEETSIIKSMQLIYQHVGIVTEPSGAVGVAAILENQNTFKGKNVVHIICGGNLTQEQIKKYL